MGSYPLCCQNVLLPSAQLLRRTTRCRSRPGPMMGHGYLPSVSPGAHVVLEGAWDSGAPEVGRQESRG